MQAVAVIPHKPNSAHLTDLPKPSLGDVPDGRGVLVRVLRVGIDGTDREINAGAYGAAPPGDDFLVIGHESFGRVEAVGDNVRAVQPGDYVVATVRRPGGSIYDRIGAYDMSTDEEYHERGINLLHGFLTEYYVDDPQFIVRVPDRLKEVGVLLEPLSMVEKGIAQAYEIQRRLRLWHARRAAVLGAGSVGLLATLLLRLRYLDVVTFGLTLKPYLNAELAEAIGARYESTRELPLVKATEKHGPFDLIFEATGFSPLAFEAMQALNKNGVLVLASVTGGKRRIEVPSDKINLDLVLGNRVVVGTVNANREYFEAGICDMALAEARYPGWLARLLTHKIEGLDRYSELLAKHDGIKVFCEIAA